MKPKIMLGLTLAFLASHALAQPSAVAPVAAQTHPAGWQLLLAQDGSDRTLNRT